MRSGLTTGTCAAAAAKAAALLLVGQTAPAAVDVPLPSGERVTLEVVSAVLFDRCTARACVVKDAGDDPDVTNGMTVMVTLELGGENVRFAAGEGVGTVTREGLQLAPGEPAINPVPREMIVSALAEVFGEGADVLVTVSVIGGAEIAGKTFNPRLGIEGGISILGTTGRVEPKSFEAWMRALLPQVDMAIAAGHVRLWLSPGGFGEQFAIDTLGAPAQAVVRCSNFVGDLLDACGGAGAQRIVLVGHAGKLVKVAAGLFDTHSRMGDARLETVAAVAAAEGAPGPLVARLIELPTVQAAVAELADAGLAHVWEVIAERAARRAGERAGVPVEVVLLGYGGELLGATAGVGRDDRQPDGGSLAVVGAGPGSEDLVTPLAWREIRRADVVAGGARLLDAFAPIGAERITIGADMVGPLAAVAEAVAAGRRVVVLASGDPAFFGVLASVRRELPQLTPSVVPGISSAQLALARLGLSWEGVAIASAHGRDPSEALATCSKNSHTLVLVDRITPPQAFSAALSELGDFEVTVLERLGYPEERVTAGPAAAIAAGGFDALSVLFVRSV
ncbi:MAG: cobalt-precorrin-5B (C(1))-methyltransferase CbiD [Thermoleophilia bacterium]